MALDKVFFNQLADLGRRIEQKMSEFRSEGTLHGHERAREANWKLSHSSALRRSASPQTTGELAHDVEILKLTFERWLARLDERSEHASRQSPAGGWHD